MDARYEGRPGLSPAVALLVARGDIRTHHTILDVGCGTGTDAILLAKWGYGRVVGIDTDRGAIAIARRRAARMRLQRRVRFIAAAAEDLEDHLRPASVDVVLHTLVGNNLDERDDAAHYRAVARVMKPRALIVASMRTVGREENLPPGRVVAPPALRKHFRLTPGVTTQLAEHGGFTPPYARVALWVGRRR